jgi:type I restriction-modification system DNA methylase subunit
LVKRDVKNIKTINYTIDNQKITFDFLNSHLWSTADILRGSLDPGDYRQPVMTLLFLKRLNDTFEENTEKLIRQGNTNQRCYLRSWLYYRIIFQLSIFVSNIRYLHFSII